MATTKNPGVLWNVSQTLETEDKTRARNNIGAVSADDVSTAISGKVDDTDYATSSAYGIVKLGSDTVQSTAAETVTSTTGRTYAVQKNANGQLLVNVPWTDSQSVGDGTLTINQGNTQLGTFTANQSTPSTINVQSYLVSAGNGIYVGSGTAGNTTTYTVGVNQGDGLMMTISSSPALKVKAGDGISVSSDGVAVNAGTGLAINSQDKSLYVSDPIPPRTSYDANKVLTVTNASGSYGWVDQNAFFAKYGEPNYSDALAAYNANKMVYTIIPASETHSTAVVAIAATIYNSTIYFRSTVTQSQISSTYFASETSAGVWSYSYESLIGLPPTTGSAPGRVLTLNDNLGAEWGIVESGDSLPPHGSGDGYKVLALSPDGVTPGWYSNYKRTDSFDQAFTSSQQIYKSDGDRTYLYLKNSKRCIRLGISSGGNLWFGDEKYDGTGQEGPSGDKLAIYSSGTGDNITYGFNGNATSATSATKATKDGDGNTISSTYAKLDSANTFTNSQVIAQATPNTQSFIIISNNRRSVGLGTSGNGTILLQEIQGKADSPTSQQAIITSVNTGNNTRYEFKGKADSADSAEKWNGYSIEVVEDVPGSWAANTIYFI